MRKVKARLLKLNDIFKSDKSEEEEDNQEKNKFEKSAVKYLVPPPVPAAAGTAIIKLKAVKKQSKWGKTTSSEPSLIPFIN